MPGRTRTVVVAVLEPGSGGYSTTGVTAAVATNSAAGAALAFAAMVSALYPQSPVKLG